MDGHGYVRRPKGFRGKVRGGMAVGCACGAMTVVGSLKAGLRWHDGHVRALGAPVEVASVDVMQARLDELRTSALALIGG